MAFMDDFDIGNNLANLNPVTGTPYTPSQQLSQWGTMDDSSSVFPNSPMGSSGSNFGSLTQGLGNAAGGIFGSLGSLFGGSGQGGGFNLGGLLGTLGNAYLGYKGLQQAEDEFDFQKEAFNRQFAAQKNLINEQLARSRDYYLRSHNRNMTEEERKAAVDAYVKEKGVS